MTFECPHEVTNDYETLLETDDGCDVIIYVGENENVKEIHAHSLILRARSQYFRAALSKEWSEKKDGRFIFKKPNILPPLFKMILRFIYCGKIDLAELQGLDALKLLIAVDELNIQTLINCIHEYFEDELLQKNPVEILEIVYKHRTFTDLWNCCLKKICAKPEILFNSDNFFSIKAPLLKLLLKRDDLDLDEIVIWDRLIKWCLAQHSNISRDATRWDKEQITAMKRTIHGFISSIRFCHISPNEFIVKVYPFKEIIPKNLINNILLSHIAPNKDLNMDVQPFRQSKIVYDSVLIEYKHFALFAGWIEKKNNSHYNARNISFNLLYRASKDGISASAFHAKCDKKGATIVIARIKNSEQIVGGYNPLHWDSYSGYKTTSDSFLFSFTKSKNMKSAKVNYVKNNHQQHSIYCNLSHGPTFGGGFGFDLSCYNSGGIWYSHPSSYSKLDGIPALFNVDDCEIFQVVNTVNNMVAKRYDKNPVFYMV